MLSLTLVIALAGTARATYDLMLDWLDSTLNADLFVTSSPTIVNRRFPFPASMAADIARIPGVSRVQTVRVARIMLEGAPAVVGAVEAGSLAETVRPRIVEGDRVEMFRLTAAGHGLIVSDILAQLRHKHFGEVLEIAAPQGMIRLPIVGIVVDVSDQQGIIFMDRALFSQYWHDDTASFFRLYVSRGAPVAEIKRRILERYAPERQVFVLTNADLRAFVLKVNDQWFALSWIQIAVAVLVAILGIVNTLAVSIVDRRREFGVLRAVGGLDWQIRRMIGLEALSIGTLGLVLGFAFGAINLYFVLQMAHNNVLGMRLEYEFPFAVALGMVPTILGSALIAAIWPAHAVTGGHLVSALEYE
jgi:putative ABC transport system permease protein